MVSFSVVYSLYVLSLYPSPMFWAVEGKVVRVSKQSKGRATHSNSSEISSILHVLPQTLRSSDESGGDAFRAAQRMIFNESSSQLSNCSSKYGQGLLDMLHHEEVPVCSGESCGGFRCMIVKETVPNQGSRAPIIEQIC